jgi:hypothetical protein
MFGQVRDRAREWSLFTCGKILIQCLGERTENCGKILTQCLGERMETCGKILTQCLGERTEPRNKEPQYSPSDNTGVNAELPNTKKEIITTPPVSVLNA